MGVRRISLLEGNGDRTIPYHPFLKDIFGSVSGAIVYAQLEYWFSRTKGEPFYKFLEPVEGGHPAYKEGDSLCEELSFGHVQVLNELNKMCRMHKSKAMYDKCEDKFDSLPFCSYYDRVARMKYYFRNHDVCNFINTYGNEIPKYKDGRSTIHNLEVLESSNLEFYNHKNDSSILYVFKRLQQENTYITHAGRSFARSETASTANPISQWSFANSEMESSKPTNPLADPISQQSFAKSEMMSPQPHNCLPATARGKKHEGGSRGRAHVLRSENDAQNGLNPTPYAVEKQNGTLPNGLKEEDYSLLLAFDDVRKLYKGTKKGRNIEFKALIKHKDWRLAVEHLLGNLERYNRFILHRRKSFDLQYKNFTTYLNQRCWEEVYETDTMEAEKPKYIPTQNNSW